MPSSTLTNLSAASALDGTELFYAVQSGADRKVTATQLQSMVLNDATNNDISTVLTLTHTTSGTPANGIGVGMNFVVETSNNNNEIGAQIQAVTTDVTGASEDFDLSFKLMAAGAAATEAARITSAGTLVSYAPDNTLFLNAANGNFGFRAPVGSNASVAFSDSSASSDYASYMYLTGFVVSPGDSYNWSSGSPTNGGLIDLRLFRDAANILAQRSSTNAQTFRVYNTYTDSSNFERGVIDWGTTANILTVGTQYAGTGTARVLDLRGHYILLNAYSTGTLVTLHNGILYGNISLGYNGGGTDCMTNVFLQDAGMLRWSTADTGLARNAAGVVEVNNGSAGTFRELKARSVIHSGVTVANLPGSPTAGQIAYVTDANATTIGTTVAGGGSNKVLVWYNGTNWRIYAN